MSLIVHRQTNNGWIRVMEIERVVVTLKTCKSMVDQLESLGANIVTESLEANVVKKAQNNKGKTFFKATIPDEVLLSDDIYEKSVLVSYAKGLFDKT